MNVSRSEFLTIDFKRLSEEKQDFTGYEAEIIYTDGNDNIDEKHGYRTQPIFHSMNCVYFL